MTKNKYKVLIVDDDEFLLDIYTTKFKEGGLEVDTAVGGEEALIKIKEKKDYDIIVLDIVMPIMDGYALLEKIREQKLIPSAVIIVLTNQGQSTDVEKARKYGIQGYIVKASTIPSEVLKEVLDIASSHIPTNK